MSYRGKMSAPVATKDVPKPNIVVVVEVTWEVNWLSMQV